MSAARLAVLHQLYPHSLLAVIRLFAIAAAALSGYLVWLAVTDYVIPGCGVASDCDYVLGSRWSRVLGIPIAAVAIGVHLITFIASLAAGDSIAPRWRRIAWIVMVLSSSSAVGAAAWLFYVQLELLHSVCPYCMADHGIAVILWLLIVLFVFRKPSSMPWKPVTREDPGYARPADRRPRTISRAVAGAAVVIGFVAAAGFAYVQSQNLGGAYHVAAMSQPLDLPYDQVPVIGPTDAPHAIFLLGDYTCPHCRELHEWLAQAQERYGRQITVVVLPIPVNTKCNRGIKHDNPMHQYACEINRLALAAWRASPEKYAKVDALLFAAKPPLLPDDARAQIGKVVGEENLRRAEQDPRVDQDLARDIDLFMNLGAGVVPKLLIGKKKLDGPPSSPLWVFELIEREFRIRPVAK
jgi:uncharacterized membrane protein